jgi:hypothetical protein
MAVRYRCSECGNLTRFDVVVSRRTRAYHHFTVGGDLQIEDEEVLDSTVEAVTCRWCGATGASIEEIPVGATGTGAVVADPVEGRPADRG